jgi:uncharacterized membrane protein YbhN (UPF0104 family)
MSDRAQQGQGADDVDPPHGPARRGVTKLAIFAAKFAITALCFCYVSRRVDFAAAVRTLPTLDLRWIALAVLVALLQIPLLGLRWCEVLDALALRNRRMTRNAVIGVTAIGAFFTQVLPNVAGEGMRVWYLARLGCDWRNGIISVLIDRGVGIGLMVAFAVAILLVPSPLTALAGYRGAVLAIYGALLTAGILGLVFAPAIAAGLQRWRYTGWLAAAARDARRAIIGPRGVLIIAIGSCVHAFTVLILWLLGQSQGLSLPVFDAAVLFVVMIGIALVPISVGGWGLREFAVVAVMGDYGLAPERALLFSVCFGLVLVAGALPGALVWLLYSVPPPTVE